MSCSDALGLFAQFPAIWMSLSRARISATRRRRFGAQASVSRAQSIPQCQHRERSEEHTSELQSLMRISYAVFCLKKKINWRSQITKTQLTSRHSKLRHPYMTTQRY